MNEQLRGAYHHPLTVQQQIANAEKGAAMTATMDRREVGHEWYDRHAMRGNREIIEYSRNAHGPLGGTRVIAVTWDRAESMHTYYRNSQGGARYFKAQILEHMTFTWLAAWEEAEAWLFAPTGGAA